MNQYDYSEELETATELVRECASQYMRYEHRGYSEKRNAVGSFDIVTDDDTKAEDIITDGLHAKYPDDAFICEERQNEPLGDRRTWVIDPIDGTLNYQRNIPLFGTQLVLMERRQPVLAVIYLPASDEMYTATGDGAFLNGRRLTVAPDRALKECIISLSDFSRKCQYYRDTLSRFIDRMYDEVARLKIFGAACCDFAMISSGKTDMHMRFVNNIWDFMPGLYISRMAGVYIDEELLDRYSLLLMGPNGEVCGRFREKVIDPVLKDSLN